MKRDVTACERCGLREVRYELERKGKIIRFCDECYWGEIAESTPTTTVPPRLSEPTCVEPQAEVTVYRGRKS